MNATSTRIEQAALDWLVRVNDPAFDQWEVWDGWMAADPHHAEAYWRLAAAEAEVVDAVRSAPPLTARTFRPTRRFVMPRRAAMAAAFALVAVGGGVWFAWNDRGQAWSIETAPGEQRTVTLADGSVVSLDGGTRLALDRRDRRAVTLQSGRALFDVVHDDAHPFQVDVGGATLTDLGTIFDVTRLDNGARVAVSEGQVRVDADGASLTLNPGDSVIATSSGLEARSVALEDVAGWRAGRLSYAGERLSVVAQDLARVLNRPVRLAPALTNSRFSGSLNVATASDRTRLEALLGVSIADDGEGWRLEPRPTP